MGIRVREKISGLNIKEDQAQRIKNEKKGGKVFKHKQARKRQGDLANMVIPSELIIELRKKTAKKNKIQAFVTKQLLSSKKSREDLVL